MIGRVNTGGGGGNRYSLLTVTTEESTLQSESVTITGTDSVTGKVDTQTKRLSNGTVTVKLKYLTTYTITCGEATAEVDVTSYADYSAQISLWDGEIFVNGKKYESVTGGLDIVKIKGTANIVIEDKIRLNRSTPNNYGAVITHNKVSFKGYNKVNFHIDAEEDDGHHNVAICTDNTPDKIVSSRVAGHYFDNSSSPASRVFEINVSDLQDGEYYVCVIGNKTATNAKTSVYSEIRMTR